MASVMRVRDDRGSVTAEAVVLLPILVMLLVLVGVYGHRGLVARLHINEAAHQAARAASIERTAPHAGAAARTTAAAALVSAGITCHSLLVDAATGTFRLGGVITVTVSCTVDFGDAQILGLPGSARLSASASEAIDVWRSRPPGGRG